MKTAILYHVVSLPRPRPEWMPLHLRRRLMTLVRPAPVVVALPPTWQLLLAGRPLPPPCRHLLAWRPLPPPCRPQRRPIDKVLKMPCATALNMNVVVRVFARLRY